MQMNSKKKDELGGGGGGAAPRLGMQLAYYIQLTFVGAVTDLHLQLPLHTWERAGFIDSISGMLSQPTRFPE